MVNERQFRADLFYRLNVFPIELPPLRNRPEDIPLLVHHFAGHYAARMRKRITAISEEFMAALARQSWLGNVRELQNFIERSVILSTPPTTNSQNPFAGPNQQTRYWHPSLASPLQLWPHTHPKLMKEINDSGDYVNRMYRIGMSPAQKSKPPASR
jgi:transcriptional regulator with GAF, ATPase, and Fis domain